MAEPASWHAEARRLLDAGMPITEVAKIVGRNDKRVRVALNINGAGDRERAYRRVADRQERAERHSRCDRVMPSRGKPVSAEEPQPYVVAPRRPTLPKISLPDLTDEPILRRFAPRIVAKSNPGAERIRQIHRAMIRRGLIADPSDLFDRLSH